MTAPVITLTFDNGPTPGITEPILELLAQHAVPATFFAIGRKLANTQGQRLGKRTIAEGHRLGGHTWSHSVQFGAAPDDVIIDELDRTSATVDECGGDALLFRPYGAGGVIDDRLMNTFGAARLCSMGYTCVLWNVLPGDWRDASGWVDKALPDIERQSWSVVVLHDVAEAALPRLGEFLTTMNGRNAVWSQEFPDACTPIRDGSPTASFGTLCLSN
ncbi:MAG: peptidoglycan-N-acetylglucosamine deacetylase [Ilumatobacteraceae bacterium]|jgi:peptidoglycan/xylan/chitin deacetylase (PgdA/CDA1 family)